MDKMFEFISVINSLKRENNATLIESIQDGFLTLFENTDIPQSPFNVKDLKGIRSFAGRIKYVAQRLEKLGSGSSRAAYLIDNDTVLKLAINKKGLAQNQVESDVANLYDIVPEVIDADYDDDVWIICKRANKLKSPKRFEELTKISWENFAKALVYELIGRREGKPIPKPDNMDQLWDDEFFSSVVDMAVNYDMPVGDLTRLGSYGELDGKPVVIDTGLTKDVLNQYYNK
jgi:hypothetical protein